MTSARPLAPPWMCLFSTRSARLLAALFPAEALLTRARLGQWIPSFAATAGYCKIPWLCPFTVSRSERFGLARSAAIARHPWRASPPLRPRFTCRYTQAACVSPTTLTGKFAARSISPSTI